MNSDSKEKPNPDEEKRFTSDQKKAFVKKGVHFSLNFHCVLIVRKWTRQVFKEKHLKT